MLVCTREPGARYRGGFRAWPTPPGVPVAMTSPGCRVTTVETYATSATGSKSRSAVVSSWTVSPSTLVLTVGAGRRRAARPASPGTGRAGSSTPRLLPCSHSRVRNCQSRQVTSLRTAYPAMAWLGLRRVARRRRVTDDDGEFALPVHVSPRSPAVDDGSSAPDERVGELREEGGVLGQVAPHLPDVVAVVQADADDLPGAGEPAVSKSSAGAVVARRSWSLSTRQSGPRQQCADVGNTAVDEHGVTVDPDRAACRRWRSGSWPASCGSPSMCTRSKCSARRSGRR